MLTQISLTYIASHKTSALCFLRCRSAKKASLHIDGIEVGHTESRGINTRLDIEAAMFFGRVVFLRSLIWDFHNGRLRKK